MKKIIIGLFILVLSFIITEKKYIVIPEESIRLRVIPSSNALEDIYVKEKVTNKIIEILNLSSINLESSREEINNLKNEISKSIEKIFKELNYNKNYEISYGENYFPKKVYKDVLYSEGNYESLVITIGNGSGDNFWCVLFPPLCNLEYTDNTKDVEYKLKVKEVLDNLMNNI